MDGNYQLYVADVAGNLSAAAPGTVIVDHTPPDPTLELEAASDSGASDSDDITNINEPTLVGGAEPASQVEVFDGETSLGSTVADDLGAWSLATVASTTTTTLLLPTCGPAPELPAGCHLADAGGAGKSSFQIKNKPGTAKDQIKWKWGRGVATPIEDFGDQVNGIVPSRLCVYDASANPQPLMDAEIPGGAGGVVCGKKACWKASGPSGSPRGYKYKDSTAAQNGMQTVLLKGSDSDRAKVLVKGKGTSLPDPSLPIALPLSVQLVNRDSGLCWQSTFLEGDVKRNEGGQFKAKGSN